MEEDKDEPIHQSLSAPLRSTAFTGGSKSVTWKSGNDQNFTHFCRFVVRMFGFKIRLFRTCCSILSIGNNFVKTLSILHCWSGPEM